MKYRYWLCYIRAQNNPVVVSVYAQTREQARAIACIELGCRYIDVAAFVDNDPPPEWSY